ncbi:hypothetical protein Psta_3821 [Pirellula staleyi DSM 6068]|uniref:Uncharacterized protein n=1 Tax=Pirellula staleyi (strain ATCC 27377 / DSM 6068 / ICPB 4128) TaxID=530564 RepID=D2R0Z1_PIRSD|nr:hypothetical protein [Pirellula staleyi]ADB18476.1 hypothetical protein Psta_3821 [Pirellula staleyi DSM 6068]
MPIRNSISAVLTLVLLATTQVALANNNLFLPGDAYFPAIMTQEDVERVLAEKVGERRFEYSSFRGYDGAFCGFAGYGVGILQGVDDPFAKNLASVYQHIRTYQFRELREIKHQGKLLREETNGMQVLFYPTDFDFKKQQLGLRYNENWVDAVLKFGHDRSYLRYCSLVNDPEAVAGSWRDGAMVPGLKFVPGKVDRPAEPAESEKMQGTSNPLLPAIIQGKVRAYVLPSGVTLTDLFQNKIEPYTSMYEVTSEGVVRYEYRGDPNVGTARWEDASKPNRDQDFQDE